MTTAKTMSFHAMPPPYPLGAPAPKHLDTIWTRTLDGFTENNSITLPSVHTASCPVSIQQAEITHDGGDRPSHGAWPCFDFLHYLLGESLNRIYTQTHPIKILLPTEALQTFLVADKIYFCSPISIIQAGSVCNRQNQCSRPHIIDENWSSRFSASTVTKIAEVCDERDIETNLKALCLPPTSSNSRCKDAALQVLSAWIYFGQVQNKGLFRVRGTQ